MQQKGYWDGNWGEERGHRTFWPLGMFMILIGVIILLVYVKPYQIMYFKYMQLIGGQLYLNKAIKTNIIHVKSWLAVRVCFLYALAPCTETIGRSKLPPWPGEAPGAQLWLPGLPRPLPKHTCQRKEVSNDLSLCVKKGCFFSPSHFFARTRPSWCLSFNNYFFIIHFLEFSYGHQHKSNHLNWN